MKRHIKHKFKHTDPENELVEKVLKKSSKVPKKAKEKPSFLISDIKKTIYIILAFMALLIALYVVNLKMNFLEPIFNRLLT